LKILQGKGANTLINNWNWASAPHPARKGWLRSRRGGYLL